MTAGNYSGPANDTADILWKFVRGDLSIGEFEQFVYGTPQLRDYLGTDLHFKLIENDYKNKDATFQLKQSLAAHQRAAHPAECKCIELQDLAVIDMGSHEAVFQTLNEVALRGQPYWWLYLSVCGKCSQHWLVAQEERQNDIFCLQRLDLKTARRVIDQGIWPSTFDRYEDLLTFGMQAGRTVRFFEPTKSISLKDTIVDVAKDRPGVPISHLSKLLNIDVEVLREICREVIAAEGVTINLDT